MPSNMNVENVEDIGDVDDVEDLLEHVSLSVDLRSSSMRPNLAFFSVGFIALSSKIY